MFSKFDVLIIAALSLGGTGAMVEAGNRVALDQAEAVAIEEPAAQPQACSRAELAQNAMFMRYAARALNEIPPGMFCGER